MRTRVGALTVTVLFIAAAAQAQVRPGIRAGVSAEPDQFFFGGHIETGPLVEQLTFRPNVEVGVGSETTVVALNIEFVYSVPLQKEPWRVYFGAGPAVNIVSSDGDDGVGGGFNMLVGVQHAGGLFTELKVGALDSPTLKFTVGYQFR